MPEQPKWQSQLPGIGNNIPDSYLKRLYPHINFEEDQPTPEEEQLQRFIREEL